MVCILVADMEPHYRHGIPWAGSDHTPRQAVAAHAASTLQHPGPSWKLPKTELGSYVKSMMAAAHVYQAHCSSVEEDIDADAVMLGGSELLQLTRSVWDSLGAGEDEAEAMCTAMEAAAVEQHGELQLSWLEFKQHIRTAYTEVVRQQVLTRCLEEGLSIVRAAGTAITLSQVQAAMAALKECVAADPAEEAVEGMHARLQLAKLLVAYAASTADLQEAERLLAQVLGVRHKLQVTGNRCTQTSAVSARTAQDQPSHTAGKAISDTEDSDEERLQEELAERQMLASYADAAGTLLGLILAQSQRDTEAAGVMAAEGYRYRLSPAVLAYALPQPCKPSSGTGKLAECIAADTATFVAAMDHAVPVQMLQALQQAFSPASSFWHEHGYTPDGSTPYFSYVHKLPDMQQSDTGTASHPEAAADASLMDQVIAIIRAHLVRQFPEAAGARWAEWWAHCRPHSHGHQLHFDSDNEGLGVVRNPFATSVLYLSDEGVGGPTLVTTQAFDDKHLVPSGGRGWLVHPRPNRLAMLKGDVLHGVIPGRGIVQQQQQQPGCSHAEGSAARDTPNFRVTLMVALWRDIQLRTYPSGQPPGAAMPYPYPQAGKGTSSSVLPPRKKQRKGQVMQPSWPGLLLPASPGTTHLPADAPVQQGTPDPVSPVWTDVAHEFTSSSAPTLDQLALDRRLPSYDACFQGF